VHAQRQQLKQVYELRPVSVQKVQYGKTQTKRAITNVLDAILPTYQYASLPELNTALKQYNTMADSGSEHSRTFSNNGLVYRVLDEWGQKIGTPIKASGIYNTPDLSFLTENSNKTNPLNNRINCALKIPLTSPRSKSQGNRWRHNASKVRILMVCLTPGKTARRSRFNYQTVSTDK
jgi:hypothetical protein